MANIDPSGAMLKWLDPTNVVALSGSESRHATFTSAAVAHADFSDLDIDRGFDPCSGAGTDPVVELGTTSDRWIDMPCHGAASREPWGCFGPEPARDDSSERQRHARNDQ